MKKIVLTLSLLVGSLISAQDFTVTNGDNGVITDGEVFTFTSLGADSNIHIQINNNSDQDLYFKLKAESGENTNGVLVNFCFGQVCLPQFNPGQYVPPAAYENIMISPGGTNDINDKFFITTDATIENTPVVFDFGLYQYDSADQDQTTGTKVLSFSYQYAPTASTPSITLQKLGVQVDNTLVKDVFSFTAENALNVELFDLNGKVLAQYQTEAGQQTLDLSSLQNAVYIVKFASKEGKVAYSKIVKQ
jgi:hypothetical protein